MTTTPAWTALLAMASAVVIDIGGPLSHSSIVARGYGIPAVMATGVGTRRIVHGAPDARFARAFTELVKSLSVLEPRASMLATRPIPNLSICPMRWSAPGAIMQGGGRRVFVFPHAFAHLLPILDGLHGPGGRSWLQTTP